MTEQSFLFSSNYVFVQQAHVELCYNIIFSVRLFKIVQVVGHMQNTVSSSDSSAFPLKTWWQAAQFADFNGGIDLKCFSASLYVKRKFFSALKGLTYVPHHSDEKDV